jgi:PAS domain S-box-containing protein
MTTQRWQVAAAGGGMLLALGGLAGWMQARLGAQLLPHAFCITGSQPLLWLHLLSDAAISLAYLVIPVALWHVARRRRDIPFGWVGLLFAAFIVSCGITHAMEVWTLYQPVYWYSGVVKVFTAVASLGTAAVLIRLLPQVLALPSSAQLRQANDALQREVATRRQVEAELRAAQAELQTLVGRTTRQAQEAAAVLDRFFEAAPLGMVVFDEELRFVRINRRLADMNGAPPAEHAGRRLQDVLPQADPRVAGLVQAVRDDGQARENVELTHVGRDGRTLHRLASYFPIARQGAPALVGGTVQDITWQREVERQRAEALEAAEQANRMKDRFLAQVSHELRSPLQVAVSSAEVLRRLPGLPDQARTFVERLAHSTHLQSRLISDLLDLSRILSGKLHIAPEVLDPAAPLLGRLDHWREQAGARGITLDAGDLQAGRARVEADPARLEQVYANLLDNAIRFSADGGRITLSASVLPGGRWRLAVRDEGAGLAPDELVRIFEPFAQGSSRAHGHKGLGLGLAIVQNLVQAFGGTLWARSPGKGQGSTFFVELPLASGEAMARPGPTEPPAVRLDGVALLYVEDDPTVGAAMQDGLREAGARVALAADHAAARAALRAGGHDVLVTDLDLGPGPGGVDLLLELRSAGEALMPAIAVSAFGSTQDRARTREAGFAAHLVKPVDAQAVARAVRVVLDEADD